MYYLLVVTEGILLHMLNLQDEVQQADEAFALDWYKNDGYTNVGQAVFDIKYRYIYNRNLTVEQLDNTLSFLVNELLRFTNDVDLILPVPSFNPRCENNPEGDLKIMYIVAESLSKKSGKNVDFSILEKTSSNQAKDSTLSARDYISGKLSPQIQKVLLIDDLFGEGCTANYTVSALKEINPSVFVRFVSLTKNKYGGIHKCYDCRISKYVPHSIMDNGNESIDLYFYKDNKPEHVKIWSNHRLFQEIKEAYRRNDFNRVFEFSIYKKQNGYWQIDDD